MDNLNTGRQSLLLELTRDIIQNTNAGFDDSSIKFKIDKYIELLAQAKVNIKKLSNEEQEELVDLHKFFYGTEFNLEKPLETDSGISTNIFQEFSKAFTIIHKLVTETDELNEKLIDSLSKILANIEYIKDEKIKSEFLNLILYNIKKFKKTDFTDRAIVINKTKEKSNLETKTDEFFDKSKTEKTQLVWEWKNDGLIKGR